MGNVQTDLEAMIDFRARLMRFNAGLDADYHGMVASWQSLGDVWRDAKYAEFGDALNEVGRGIERYLAATASHQQHLLRLIEAIQSYQDVR